MFFPSRKAFTLIELLVVIAVIAVISIVVVTILNPAQLLMQSRDSNRLSDMSSLKTALNVFSAQGGSSFGSSNVVYVSVPDPTATSTAGDQCQGLGLPSLPGGYTYQCAASSTFRLTNGSGWIPVNFNALTGGSPIGTLPIDPVNQSSSDLYYTYMTNGTQYEITALLESQKYQTGGSDDKVSTDGGQYSNLLEVGNNLALAPMDFAQVPITVTQSGNLIASRSLKTVYQNTSGNVMFVSIVDHSSGGGTTWALTGTSSPPTNVVSEFSNNNNYDRPLFFPVLPGSYYEINYDNTVCSLDEWFESTVSGISLSQSNVLASRALNTIYQNTTGNDIFASIMNAPGGVGSTWTLTGTSSPPTSYISAVSSPSGYGRNMFVPVMPGSYYEVGYDTGTTLDIWYEWGLSNAFLSQNGDLVSVRSLNTIYQNTTGYPMFVSVRDSATGGGSTWALTGSSSPPTNEVSAVTTPSSGYARTLFFLVPAGSYYEVSYDTGSSVTDWFEWTL